MELLHTKNEEAFTMGTLTLEVGARIFFQKKISIRFEKNRLEVLPIEDITTASLTTMRSACMI